MLISFQSHRSLLDQSQQASHCHHWLLKGFGALDLDGQFYYCGESLLRSTVETLCPTNKSYVTKYLEKLILLPIGGKHKTFIRAEPNPGGGHRSI